MVIASRCSVRRSGSLPSLLLDRLRPLAVTAFRRRCGAVRRRRAGSSRRRPVPALQRTRGRLEPVAMAVAGAALPAFRRAILLRRIMHRPGARLRPGAGRAHHRADLLGAATGALAARRAAAVVLRPDRALPLIAAARAGRRGDRAGGRASAPCAAVALAFGALIGLAAAVGWPGLRHLALQAAAADTPGRGHGDRRRARQPDRPGAGRPQRAASRSAAWPASA